MTISYVLAIQPLWYIVGLDGLAAGGAQLFTYDSLTRQPRPTFQDPAGAEPNENPILFDLNGTWGPIYWQVDTDDPQGYYIEAYDIDGNLLFEADNFPTNGGGGGSDVTEFRSFKNYITNNQFINHISSSAGSSNLLIAPSNHKGFTPAQANPLVGTYGVLGPDIRFIKNSASIPGTDNISFPTFALSSSPMSAGGNSDMTPVDYIQYTCTVAATGETYKDFQFPISQKVKNLSNQIMTFTLWAAVTSVPKVINIYTRQYYGSGTTATAESTSTRVLQDSFTLSSTWTKYVTQFTMPNVAGNSIGAPGAQTDDDAVYIEIEMPLDDTSEILFTKPCLYLGLVNPNIEFDSYDQIDSINSTARTGDIKTSLLSSPPLGWVAMDDGSIGNTGSGATNAIGAFTFQLYSTIYTSVSDTWAPVTGGRTAPGNTMTAAITDFLANKKLTLPKSLGRALAGAGGGTSVTTARALGQSVGSEIITVAAMPAHQHPELNGASFWTNEGGAQAVTPGAGLSMKAVAKTGIEGSTAADGNMPPTSFFNVFIKL